MGIYNTFGERGVQLKAEAYEDLQLKHYKLGDAVKLGDGIYVGYEGVVVILNGVFIAEFAGVWDKWGGFVGLNNLLAERNPIGRAIAELEKDGK